MDSASEINVPPLQVDFQRLAEALSQRGIMEKSVFEMTREEIEDLCKIVAWATVDAPPF